jgi:hypothetical protein
MIIVLKLLFSGRELSIRELHRLSKYRPTFVSENNILDYLPVMLSKAGAKQNSVLKQYKLLIIIKMFSEIYGSSEIFLLKLKKAINKYSNNIQVDLNYHYGALLEDIVLFADIENHKFNFNKVQEANLNSIEFHLNKGHLFSYKVYGGYYSNYYEEGEMWFRCEIERAIDLKISYGKFHAILVSAVENVVKYGLI